MWPQIEEFDSLYTPQTRGEILIRDERYGTVFRGWKVLEYLEEKTNDGHKLYTVECPFCGYIKERTVLSDLFQANNLCLHHIKKVREWPSGLRSIFLSMKKHCYNCNDKDYRYYGAKGIAICDEWLNDPNTFVQWAESNGYHKGLTIDRIDSLMEIMINVALPQGNLDIVCSCVCIQQNSLSR